MGKGVSNAAGDTPVTKVKRAEKTAQPDYVPLEDGPTVGEGAADKPNTESAKPSMQEVFGPGGFLEKCMKGGFDPATVSSDYEHRPGPLEMAERGRDAFESDHPAIVEAGRRPGTNIRHPS